MNRELKRISALVLVMFTALFVASSIIQVFQTDQLESNARNQRARADQYAIQRGRILTADGKAIVTSPKSDDTYQFDRKYTDGKLYAAVTGYYNPIGAPTGIEGALNAQLAGTSSDQVLDRLQNIVTGQDPKGANVQLTIQPKVQRAAYDALGDLRGAVVALDPKTGRVLAMVSKPSFDPNAIADHAKGVSAYDALSEKTVNPLVNRAIGGDTNPPGSTFKIISASAALESGRFKPSSSFPSPNSYRLPGTSTVIQNADGENCGAQSKASIALALSLSCNIPFAQLGIKLGDDALRTQAEKFGFDKPLSIPLRVTPSVYPPAPLDDAQTAQTAFGQYDDKATPMQMAMVAAAIGNSGVEMKPNLVEKIVSPSLETVQGFSPEVFANPVSADTASKVKAMMVSSVASGAATNARIDGVTVAGKTGTAQNAADAPYTLWFTGFAPADDPKVAVAVVVENGGGLGQSGYGNRVAAPIAKQVMEAVLNG
ncbi:peptidoglycan D,D-transpeptidase FtsI family protein [Amnibacterium setariae]|uniref:Penicillin-binding protein 2 n=1 Tax=Amnibacterium setariae TaxID=2306585 RepID=A0A3A1TZJ4_9MICO|nr:penicillin-binding protein 2 [Amnibacterium setariae]RIX30064.1 penicillin-binding protein 2 [Amnibacterium setariae]